MEPKLKAGKLREEVTFIMSMPRLAFTDNMYSLQNATYDLGLYGNRHGGAFWEQGMENLLEDAIEKGYKYALAIDYDTFYTAWHIIDLYNLMEENPDIGVMFPLQARRGSKYPMAGYFQDTFGHMVKVAKGGFTNGMVPCDTGHFGLSMIRLSELKKLEKPWFISRVNEDNNWRRKHKDADVNFWIKCKNEGIKVALGEVWIGHLQLMCSWCGPEDQRFATNYMDINAVLDGGMPAWATPKSLIEAREASNLTKGVSKMDKTNENPKIKEQTQGVVCERCGRGWAADQIKTYRPNAGKHPTKTVRLCPDCAKKDPNAIPMNGPQVAPETQNVTTGEGTPQGGVGEPKITEFKAVAPEPLQTSEPPAKDDTIVLTDNDTAALIKTKPIDRVDILNRINGYTADIEKLIAQGNKLRAQLGQITKIIEAKQGAIAGLEAVLR